MPSDIEIQINSNNKKILVSIYSHVLFGTYLYKNFIHCLFEIQINWAFIFLFAKTVKGRFMRNKIVTRFEGII